MEGRDEGEELLGAEESRTLLGEIRSLDARKPRRAPAETLQGLMHLVTVSAVLGLLATLPYTSEALHRFRVWVTGDGFPVVRMFLRADAERVEGGMSIATGGAVSGRTGPVSREQVAAQLGDGVAMNLAEVGTEPDAQPAPRREGLSDTEPGEPSGPAVRIHARELEGLVREIEDPSGRAMRPFYEALLRTAERQPGAITRVAHYGDSSIAGDGITSTIRRQLQLRFGDAGHGFILIARGSMPYRHVDVHHRASGQWTLRQLVRAGLRSHDYGYGGVHYRSVAGGVAEFGSSDRGPVGGAVSRFELWYQAHPRGGRVDLRVDDGERMELSTRADAVQDAWHAIEVPDGAHQLELRTLGGGETRLYGMVLERAGPGVVYDSLGMVGARARRMLGYDEGHFRRQHAHRQTNLIVLGFGGNDADDPRTPEQFERDFRQVASMVRRARPEAACLLMAPLDQAQRNARGSIETIEQVPIIVEAMRSAARAEGCAFFDTFAAMGGEGSMRRWWRAEPRLAFGDFRHATPAGYRVVGNMFYKALLKGFADYLESVSPPPATD